METIDLVKLASNTKPEIVEKIASTVKLIEAMAPEFVPEVIKEISNITNSTQEKLASISDLGKALGGAAMAALGGAIATDLFDVAKRGLTKSTNFKRIMEANPELKKDIDPARLKTSFDLIHRYAPEFTADPIMGGSILKAVAELPGNEVVMIKDLIKSRGELLTSKNRQFDFGNAGKTFGEAWSKTHDKTPEPATNPPWLKDFMYPTGKKK